MTSRTLRLSAIATAVLAFTLTSHADDTPANTKQPSSSTSEADSAKPASKISLDDLGIQLFGYMRSGFYGSTNGEPKGQYQLSGSLDHYRLGNEGDTYLEFGIGKKIDLGHGLKWGTYWMPTVYNGKTGTAQIYTDMTGIDFIPGASVWAGQRYHRIQDVHIIDNWLMQDGDDYGAGADDLDVGLGKLNVAVHSDENFNNGSHTGNNAKRVNIQWHHIPTNPGGKLTITGGVVRGAFDLGSDGGAIGALHNQDITADINNSLFLQASRGHADITGEFFGLNANGLAQPGAKQNRIVDSVNWQIGQFGGQTMLGYQTVEASNSSSTTKDLSLGGRVSYGVSRYVKLLGEVGFNQLRADGAATQHLNKETVAVALSPDTKFWTRPEFRLYATHANWNDAAGIANAATFGANNRTSGTAYGIQVEAWWN